MTGDEPGKVWTRRARWVTSACVVVVGVAASVAQLAEPVRDLMRSSWYVGWPLAVAFAALALAMWWVPAESARRDNDLLRQRLSELEGPVYAGPSAALPSVRLTISSPDVSDLYGPGVIVSRLSNLSMAEISGLRVESEHPDVRVIDVDPTSLRPMSFPIAIDANGEPYEDRDAQPDADEARITIQSDGSLPAEWTARMSYTSSRHETQSVVVRG